ncbi:MAG: PKD domain-containing protein, partial [Bacteroidota bacterium]
ATNSFCYDFTVTDGNAGDFLDAFPVSPIFTGGNNPPTFTFSGNNPIQGQVCWTPDCDLEGQVVQLTIGAMDSSTCNNALPVQSTIYVKIEVPPNAAPNIITDLTGNIFSGDTIQVNALDNFCFDFTASDPDLADALTFFPISPIFNGPNPPTITTSGTNPLQGQICWTPDCSFENQIVPLIFGAEDPGVCNNIGQALDTIYVQINVPPNDPPGIVSDLSGNTFSNDSIFVFADDAFCFSFTAIDPNPANNLTILPGSPIFTSPNPPVLTFNGTNPVQGQVCWTPGCDLVDQVVPIILNVEDDAPCSSQLNDADTVFIVVLLPPNDPPTSTHILTGLDTDGDTIFVDAAEPFCYTVVFDDINLQDSLTGFAVSPVFTGANAATFSVTGVNPLTADICWEPGCDAEGQLFEFIVRAEDNGECNNNLSVFDTVFVRVSDPLTAPPIVGSDLSGTNFVGDTIYIEIGDGVCYDFFIADQTVDNGVDFSWTIEAFGSNTLNLLSLDVTEQNDSITGTFCFQSDCSNGGSYYRVIVTGTDKATCPPFDEASDTVVIKVNTDFQSFAGLDTGFCEGSGGVQLGVTPIGGTAPYFYQWFCSDPGNCGFSSPYVGNPTVNPTDTTTYFVQITDNNGCTSEIDDVQVNVLKQPVVDAGPDRVICNGDPGIFLNAQIMNSEEAPGPYTFQWTPAAGLNNPNISTPFAFPDTTTIYTVIVGSANGCSSDNTTLDTLSTIVVNVNERPIADAGDDKDICLGESVLLTGFASQAGPNYEYIWTPAFGLQDSSSQATQASPDFTTTYFLVAWSNGCPSEADSVTIHVRALPTVSPGPGTDICYGDSVQLDGTASGDSTASFFTYEWTPATGLSDPTAAKPFASPEQTTTYSLVATSSFGCVGPAENITITVLPTPIADAGADTLLCRGDTIQLNGSHNVQGGVSSDPVFYEWSPPNGLSGLFIPNPTTVPGQTINYTLQTSMGACSSTDDVLITVSDPVFAEAFTDTSRICDGESVQLRATGGLGNAQYFWTPAISLDDPSSATPMASPNENTVYSVIIKEGACQDEASVEVAVNPTPTADYFASVDTGCTPLSISFLENTNTGTSFVWDFGDGTPISNEANPDHIYDQPGRYTVGFTTVGPGGCEAENRERQIVVVPKAVADFVASPMPPDSIPLPNALVNFIDQSQHAISYFWEFGDEQFSKDQNPTHVYEIAGDFFVRLTVRDVAGCVDQKELGPFKIFEPGLFIPNVFSPNDDGINDQFQVEYDGSESFSMEIVDRWGRLVYAGTSSPQDGWNGVNQNGNRSVEGVYYYVVKIGEKAYTGNLTLVR